MKRRGEREKVMKNKFEKTNKKDKKKKKAISTIIVMVILIAIVLIVIGTFWAVTNNIIKKQSEEILLEKLTIDVEIKGVGINENTNEISVLVRRKPGRGNLVGIKFVFNNGIDNEVHKVNTTMRELEEIIFTFSPLMNVSEILTISLIPILKSGKKEIYGSVIDVYYIKDGKSFCGNDIAELGETCDGTDLRGQNCSGLGFSGGNLSCLGNCSDYDTSQCSTEEGLICGDDICKNGENETNCPEDCEPLCGNDICGGGETLICPEDCGITSFIGADNELIVDVYNYLQSLADANINFFGKERVYWNDIEPTATSGYQWSSHDSVVQKIESVNGIHIPTLWSVSTWATEYSSSGKPSSPPKSTYDQNYYNFVKNFVERYDKDGIDDMPGLKYAHNFIVIEDEAQNIGDSWVVPVSCGSIQETQAYYECGAIAYGEMLKLAYNASNEANPNVKVGSFAFNPGDYFDANDKNIAPLNVKVYFLDKVFTDYWNYFDIISVQCNYDYTGIPTWIKYIDDTYNQPKPISQRKPIMCADAATMPMLRGHLYQGERFINRYPYKTDAEILQILSNRNDPQYNEIRSWWEAEKARLSVKKTIVSAGKDSKNIFFQFMISTYALNNNPWDYSGLVSRGGGTDTDPMGTPHIVVHALGQLNDKVSDFKSVEDLNPIPFGQDPYNWLWMYSFDNRNVYVLWNEAGGTADLSSYISTANVNVTFLVTKFESGGYSGYDPKFEGYTYPTNAVPLNNTPIFVEEI